MVSGSQILDNSYIRGVFDGLPDPRTTPQPLLFSQRVPDVNAEDGEILARMQHVVHVADLVADDQKAGVYNHNKLQYYTVNIPNLKVGTSLTQAQLNQWLAIQNNPAVPQATKDMLGGSLAMKLGDVKLGVAQRKETLLVAMYLDTFTYDRLGIKMEGAGWGTYSDLKVALAGADDWVNPTTAKPVQVILDTDQTARVRYGKGGYDRITMTSPAMRLMIATTEFQAKARAANIAMNLLSLSVDDIGVQNTRKMKALISDVLGMTVELYDARYWQQKSNGVWQMAPFLDLDAVVLDNTADDRQPRPHDFANGIVTESLVASLAGSGRGRGGPEGGPQYGPIAYPWYETLNPPQIEYYAVQRGFPRKHDPALNAVVRVGTVEETISTALPF